MAEATHWTGSDTRDLSGTPKSDAALWWRAYRMAQRTGEGAQYLAWSRPQIRFAALVAEAEREGAADAGAEWAGYPLTWGDEG